MADVNVTIESMLMALIEGKKYRTLKDVLVTMNPADIALVLEEFDEESVTLIFRLLPKDQAAETFVEMESDMQEVLIKGFSDHELREVLEEIYVDDAVDLIEEMPANVTMLVDGAKGAVKIKPISTFEVGFVLILITLLVVLNLVNSRAGRAIQATRDNRIAAESMGVSVTKYKMMAFVTAAVLAGMAGALYGLNSSTVVPTQFTFNQSINVLVFVVLGGLGNVLGSIISATFLTVLPEVLREFADYRMLVYAVVLILVMIFTNNPTTRAIADRLFAPVKKLFHKDRRETAGGGDVK